MIHADARVQLILIVIADENHDHCALSITVYVFIGIHTRHALVRASRSLTPLALPSRARLHRDCDHAPSRNPLLSNISSASPRYAPAVS